MTLLVAWAVFPVVLGALCLGCGLLLERVSALDLPAPLLLPAGFTLLSVTMLFATLGDRTSELATPAVVVLAVIGYGLSFPLPWRQVDGWLVATVAGVFAVFAAPAVLTGRATFLGYIKLDDTATYLAMLDRSLQHGYDVAGLPPSTYEATLSTSLALGYPLGSFLPLGAGQALVRTDPAWLWQPYLTFLAVLLGLVLYQLVAGVVRLRGLRALIAVLGTQAALIYGYALWGGIKELSIAMIVGLIAVLVPIAAAKDARVRRIIPLAVASACLVGVLSVGGAVWLAPLLAGAVVLTVRGAGAGTTLRVAVAFVVAACVLAIPSFVAAAEWLSHTGDFTGESGYGNLTRRLNPLQIFGIWPSGDFRTPPTSLDVTYVLVAVAGFATALALVVAWRRQAWEIPLGVGTAGFASVVYVTQASPWIGGKALASSSPIILAAALAAAAALFEGRRRTEGAALGCVIIAGVLWSNGLQYGEVFVAPQARLAELASIGHDYSGQGPTLLTEFESYGARHFLRTMDAEAASELRRREVSLRAGGVADTGVSPDVDEIQLDDLLEYRTLVLRRSGVGSRPPSVYALRSSGDNYQVWQRSASANQILEHVPAGSRLQPAAEVPCAEILRLGRLAAANDGVLATVLRPPAGRHRGRRHGRGTDGFRAIRRGCGRALSLRVDVGARTIHRPPSGGLRRLGRGLVPFARRCPRRRDARRRRP